MTPASSVCPQLCDVALGHFIMAVSLPVHAVSSNKIFPVPEKKRRKICIFYQIHNRVSTQLRILPSLAKNSPRMNIFRSFVSTRSKTKLTN